MINQRINFRIFLILYACYRRLHTCAAGSDCTYVWYMVTLAILASLIVAGLIGADSSPLGSEGHSISTPWQRTDKEISFSELALYLVPAASDRTWPW